MNPYQVLGVNENASDEEVRAAYLKLVKKYHPDRYTDNPLKDLATEKLKEINQAYDSITKQREGGRSQSYTSNNSSSARSEQRSNYSNYSGSGNNYDGYGYSGAYSPELQRVRAALNVNNLNEAAAILNGISVHNAEWNYLYGLVCFRSGDYMRARGYLEQAINMEPNNAEYRNAYDVLMRRGGRKYYASDNSASGDSCNSACNICSTLWCMDSCCECMGGDLIRCC